VLALPKSERFFRSIASLCAIRGWVCQCSEILQSPGEPKKIYELISFSAHFLLHIFIFWSFYEGFVSRLTKSPIHQQDPTVPLISVENFVKSVENLSLACGNAVECWGKTKGKNKNCKGAWGMGHGAWGMGHGAWGMGHGAWAVVGNWALALLRDGAWAVVGNWAWGMGRRRESGLGSPLPFPPLSPSPSPPSRVPLCCFLANCYQLCRGHFVEVG
jgi:hypothetical protein